jgi:hypothetical protein
VEIREALDRNRASVIPAAIIVLVISLVVIIRHSTSNDRPSISAQAYYTIDDGATFFADDVSKIAPFEYRGQTAVRANVFQCDGHKFVAFLERYTLDAKAKIEAAHGVGVGAVMADGTEVKAPLTGNAGWVNARKPEAAKLYAVHCPDGSSDQPKPVTP